MKNVTITVSSVTDGEVLTDFSVCGRLHYTPERTVLSYEEKGDMGASSCLVDITDGRVEVRRHGAVRCKMILIYSEMLPFSYETPYGVFDMAAKCTEISKSLTENGGELILRYELYTNHEIVSRNALFFKIK